MVPCCAPIYPPGIAHRASGPYKRILSYDAKDTVHQKGEVEHNLRGCSTIPSLRQSRLDLPLPCMYKGVSSVLSLIAVSTVIDVLSENHETEHYHCQPRTCCQWLGHATNTLK